MRGASANVAGTQTIGVTKMTMHAVVTSRLLTTRFYLTPEGWYSDIASRAREFNDISAAEIAAAAENASGASSARWEAANRFHDGSLVAPHGALDR